MPPHAHEAADQTEQHTEHHDEEQVLRLEEDQAGKGATPAIPEQDISRVAERQREQAAEHALEAPSRRKGPRMNQLVAPTSRMIEISRARWSSVSRIVTPMITTATAGERETDDAARRLPATFRR